MAYAVSRLLHPVVCHVSCKLHFYLERNHPTWILSRILIRTPVKSYVWLWGYWGHPFSCRSRSWNLGDSHAISRSQERWISPLIRIRSGINLHFCLQSVQYPTAFTVQLLRVFHLSAPLSQFFCSDLFTMHFTKAAIVPLFSALAVANPVELEERQSCPKVHVFGARETTAPAGYGSSNTVVNLVLQAYPGSNAEAINYPACGGQSSCGGVSYDSSQSQGTTAVVNAVTAYNKKCPNTQLVLVGYSQVGSLQYRSPCCRTMIGANG